MLRENHITQQLPEQLNDTFEVLKENKNVKTYILPNNLMNLSKISLLAEKQPPIDIAIYRHLLELRAIEAHLRKKASEQKKEQVQIVMRRRN